MLNQLIDFLQLQDSTSKIQLEKTLQGSQKVNIKQGTKLFETGTKCLNYIFLYNGSVKVLQRSVEGKEIVLYRVQNFETCILTTTHLLSRQDYASTGIAETDLDALLIPADVFHKALKESDLFRHFIFSQYEKRLSELLNLVGALSFECLDKRLARTLTSLSDQTQLSLTHQDLALEIGSTREVVSRKLKELEHLGLIQLSRGHISILDMIALKKL